MKVYKNTHNISINKGFSTNITLKAFQYAQHRNQFEQLNAIVESLKKQGYTERKILEIISNKEKYLSIPASIFKSVLSPLEAVVLFLKDYCHQNYHEIGKVISRNERTIWVTYRNAKQKKAVLDVSGFLIPVTIFSRNHTVFESVVCYLKEQVKLQYFEIAKVLGKDERNIWTVYARYKKKNERK